MKYILSIIIGVLLAFCLIIYIGIEKVEDTSDFKKLFSGPHQSLIIGTSRAARLNDSLISQELSGKIPAPGVFNYAFNLGMSPYGPLYNESIRRHVSSEDDDKGVFIICVDPWALSEEESSLNDPAVFREVETPINFDHSKSFAAFNYFLENYTKSYYNLFLPETEPVGGAYQKRPAPEYIRPHLVAKMANYRRLHFYNEKISNVRLSSLEELLRMLNESGDIYIVKLPVSREMVEMEKEYEPQFDDMLYDLVEKHQAKLLDFYPYNDNFLCPDGNHLWKQDADKVSLLIADIVALDQQNSLPDTGRNMVNTYLGHPMASYKSYLIGDE